jgi:glutamine amidotransferase
MSSTKTIVIVDYGLGNLYSLEKAVRCFTDKVLVTDDSFVISSAAAVIIPGVGAFAVGMDGLQKKNLIEPLREFAKSGKPMLGICLGAQLMLSKGFEFGEYEGLGIIPGVVKMFPELVAQKEKIPHVGWNGIYPLRTKEWSNTILASIEEKVSVYFTHSYIMIPDDPENVLAVAEYGGLEFCAVTRKGNVYGTQFHPEKSGKTGLNIIKNFIGLIK